MSHFEKLVLYLEAMTELEPTLPAADQADLQAWYQSPDFTRDSDWPGWEKYLGPRPVRQPLKLIAFNGRRTA